MIKQVRADIKKYANPNKAEIFYRFFKTKEGEYGHGDEFLGLTVPQCRAIAIKYRNLPTEDIQKLLESKYHEERLIALLMLVQNFKTGSDAVQKQIFKYYLSQTDHVNNWDLVDLSADKVVGEYLIKNIKGSGSLKILYELARSKKVWERRIAIVATYAFIKSGKCEETLKVSEMLLKDEHDLIHKAVGWMLREVGKRCSREVLVQFLNKHYKQMPRTTLRYSIEHFPEKQRRAYIEGKI